MDFKQLFIRIFFATFFEKIFVICYTYALNIYQKIYLKCARFTKQSEFCKKSIAISRKLQKSLIHLAYPTKCLHCQLLLPPEELVLCSQCSSFLAPISPHGRCLICFNLLSENLTSPCENCLHYPFPGFYTASVFDNEEVAMSLVKHLKYANQPYLAQGMAAFLFVQFERLQWPIPDALVPVPLSFTNWLQRGYNQSALLAKEMGRLLDRPVWNVLKYQSGIFYSAPFALDNERFSQDKQFRRNKNYSLQEKVLLLIDDVIISGLTLQRCAEALRADNPAALYALTFSRFTTI